MRKFFSILAILFILSAIYLHLKSSTKTAKTYEFPNVIVKNTVIKVEVADDIQEQIQGLSNKPSLKQDEGMLFLFDELQERTFWMKQMNFPLDIIWLADDKVVNISKNLPPEGEFPANKYSSQQKANRVLEVNAGFADAKKIKIGDNMQFNNLSQNN